MRGSTAKTMPSSAVSRGRSGGNGEGRPLIIIGGIFLAFFALGLMTQVETNEAFIDHVANIDVFRPNWSVFIQLPGLFLGWYDPDMYRAVFFGWFIEIIYIGLTFVGIELVHQMAHQAGLILGFLFEVIGFSAVCFNWYTDFNYGTLGSADWWGHFWFACVTAITVGYFGRFGLYLIRLGWSRV